MNNPNKDQDKQSLKRLYDAVYASPKDRDHLQTQWGVTTLSALVKCRAALAQQSYKVCGRLVEAIDCLRHHNAGYDDNNCYTILSTQEFRQRLALFLAQRMITAMQQGPSNRNKRNATDVPASTAKAKSDNKVEPPQKKFRSGDTYWVDPKYGPAFDDSESFEEENVPSVEALLGLDDENSPWKYDNATQEVVWKSLPNSIRVPEHLFRKLYPYQRIGVDWMAGLYQKKTGGILADEPGMGKTIQVLSFLTSLLHTGTIRNALIVCPKSNLETTWVKEAGAIFPHFKWGYDKGPKQPRIILLDPKWSEYQMRQALIAAKTCTTNQPHIVVASYPQIQRKGKFFNPGNKANNFFDFVVLDEAHNVKTVKGMVRLAVDKISKKSARLMLTGTPFVNDLKEIYSLFLYITGTTVLGTDCEFKEKFKNPIERGRKPEATHYEKQRGEECTRKLIQTYSPFILKRLKDGNLDGQVPESSLFDVWTRLSKLQRDIYQNELDHLGVEEHRTNGGTIQTWALPAISRLRNICMHPLIHLLKDEEGAARFKNILRHNCNAKELISQSPKLGLTISLLHQWCEKGCKALVFCQSTKMLDIIEFVLESEDGICTCRIDGSTSKNRRKTLVDTFNCTGSHSNVMLLSIGAGGEGLTLVGANKSIIYDPPWNQARQDQAAARISRPGQTRKTECIQLIAAGTVEEKMFGKAIWKGAMDRTVLGVTGADGALTTSATGCAGPQRRLFDKDELTQLFTLQPDGTCESLEKLEQKDDGNWTKKCSTGPSECSGVIGISRRRHVYGEK